MSETNLFGPPTSIRAAIGHSELSKDPNFQHIVYWYTELSYEYKNIEKLSYIMILWEKNGQKLGKNDKKFAWKFWKSAKMPHCDHKYGIPLLVVHSPTCLLIDNWEKKSWKKFFWYDFCLFWGIPKLAKLHVWETRINVEYSQMYTISYFLNHMIF